MRSKVTQLVEWKVFERVILVVILLNTVVLGLETSELIMANYAVTLELLNFIFIGIYVAEMCLKLFAYHLKYFRSGWNVFDFIIVILSLVPAGGVFSGLRILRVFRVLRVLRLVTGLKPLRKIVSSVLRSLPSIGWTVLLMVIVYYVFAIVGIHLFRPESPERFGTLGLAFATLFQLTTLDSWPSIVHPLTEAHAWAWVYFVLFMLIAAFILINVILGIVVDSLHQQDKEDEKEIIDAAADSGAMVHEQLLAEVLRLKGQIRVVEALVEHAGQA
ncbi:MAG: ion transporter [Propionibacteriaceae bacterium]|nr:ion transporter [Propionibacteriaceae bacterium]